MTIKTESAEMQAFNPFIEVLANATLPQLIAELTKLTAQAEQQAEHVVIPVRVAQRLLVLLKAVPSEERL